MSKYIILSLSVLLLFSCNKDDGDETINVKETKPIVVLNEVEGSITGYVYNLNNQPVAGASVRIYSSTTQTDALGVFSFSNVKLDQHGTFIQIKKNGYIDASDKIFPTKGNAYSSIQLIPLEENKTIQSTAGGKIAATNGGFVTFSANSIAKENGSEYSGLVKVTAYFLSPKNPNIGDLMPGDMMADGELDRTVILGTAGMMAVELRDEAGNELNLKAGSKALIEMPYTDAVYPDIIDLWSFDDDKQRWQIEGTAQRKGDFYEAEVSHFSFWNCDVPYPLVNLCGRILTENGNPIRTRVEISVGGIGTGFGYTSSSGEFCGKVPKGETLTITIKDIFCHEITKVISKGPFTNDVILDDIIVADFLPNIKGKVVCQGNLYENATVILRSEQGTYVITPRDESEFDYNINALCANLTDVKIIAFDKTTNMASPEQNVNITNGGFYELEVCETECEIIGEMIAPCGSDSISVLASGGSGFFSYAWNLSTENSSSIGLSRGKSKTYCVTITDDSLGCTNVFCKEAVGGSLGANTYSDPCYGELFGTINNGVPPFKIEYDNGIIQTIESTSFNTFNISGNDQICYIITDGNGCMTEGCEVVTFSDPPFIDSTPLFCQNNIYEFNTSEFISGFLSDGLGNIFDINNFPLRIDVVNVGYAIKEAEITNSVGCGTQSSINLPYFNGLGLIDFTNTTCDTCIDGSIYYEVNPDAECLNCVYGEAKIYNEDLIDVTNQADGGLRKGKYYVAALDIQSGCFIAHKEVIIE